MTPEPIFKMALLLAGLGHFCVLGASFQVPSRLGWKEELARLSPFNRKLMWTYGAFTVLTIIAFGVLTLVFREEMLRGDRVALGLAAFIGVFWTARLLVDFFYFKHADWPQGRAFEIGHALLTLLFLFLVGTYGGLLIWRMLP
jgi:alginate O-acetyltransferase complex protein AlgI